MAALGPPARTLRGLLRELRYMNAGTGRPYRDTAAYRYLVQAFRAHRVWNPDPRAPRPFSGVGGGARVRAARRAPGLSACLSEADPPHPARVPARPGEPGSASLGSDPWPKPRA